MPPTESDGRRATLWLPFLGAVLALLFFTTGRLPQRLEAHPGAYVPVFLAAYVVYLAALHSARIAPESRTAVRIVLAFGVLFRIEALLQPPSLSTDLWRYVWDGHVGAAGINPYRYAPSDAAVSGLRTAYWPILNHPTWVTMYPPLSQRLFTILGALGAGDPLPYKLVFVACDLATIGLLLSLLRRAGLGLRRVIVYAWSPLVVMELSGSGHQDALGITLAVAAMLRITRRSDGVGSLISGATAGLSMMAKGYLLPALPILARRRPLEFAAALVTVCALLVAPYAGPGSQILTGMNRYLHNRLRNAGIYAWILHAMPLAPASADRATRLITTAILGVIVAALTFRPWRDAVDLVRRSTLAMGAFFLLSNTVYPWYAAWLVPGACFSNGGPDREPLIAALLWSGLISLAYLNPVPGRSDWVPKVEYFPLLLLLGWQAWNRVRGLRTEV